MIVMIYMSQYILRCPPVTATTPKGKHHRFDLLVSSSSSCSSSFLNKLPQTSFTGLKLSLTLFQSPKCCDCRCVHYTQPALLICRLSKLWSLLRNGVNAVISCGIWHLAEARDTQAQVPFSHWKGRHHVGSAQETTSK